MSLFNISVECQSQPRQHSILKGCSKLLKRLYYSVIYEKSHCQMLYLFNYIVVFHSLVFRKPFKKGEAVGEVERAAVPTFESRDISFNGS